MLPQINILGKTVSTYALCGMVGILIAGWLLCKLLNERDRCDSDGILLILFSGIGIFFGSHLLYGITHLRYWGLIFKATSFREAILVAGQLFGGAVFYGGLIGGLIFAFIYIKIKKLDAKDYSDCGAVCIPLFHSVARIGCFLAGCCYGIESDFGFASAHNPFAPDVVGIKRFPTPLLEASLNLILFIILFILRKRKELRGALLYIYLLSYSIIRFLIEFLRGDKIRGIWLGISTSQWISILLCIFASYSLWKYFKSDEKKESKSQ